MIWRAFGETPICVLLSDSHKHKSHRAPTRTRVSLVRFEKNGASRVEVFFHARVGGAGFAARAASHRASSRRFLRRPDIPAQMRARRRGCEASRARATARVQASRPPQRPREARGRSFADRKGRGRVEADRIALVRSRRCGIRPGCARIARFFRLSRRGKTSVLGLRPGSRAGRLPTRAADARDARASAPGSARGPRRDVTARPAARPRAAGARSSPGEPRIFNPAKPPALTHSARERSDQAARASKDARKARGAIDVGGGRGGGGGRRSPRPLPRPDARSRRERTRGAPRSSARRRAPRSPRPPRPRANASPERARSRPTRESIRSFFKPRRAPSATDPPGPSVEDAREEVFLRALSVSLFSTRSFSSRTRAEPNRSNTLP